MNNVSLVGRLTKDPELTYTAENQTARCRFAIAIDRPVKEGDKKADFPTIITFGKQAENCNQFLTKGRLVGVSGRIETAVYERDGQKQYSTYVVARSVQFLERAKQQDEEYSPF